MQPNLVRIREVNDKSMTTIKLHQINNQGFAVTNIKIENKCVIIELDRRKSGDKLSVVYPMHRVHNWEVAQHAPKQEVPV